MKTLLEKIEKVKVQDESPVTIEVRERDDSVVLVFDKAVSWIGVTPVQAIKIAEEIRCAAITILRDQPR